MKDRTGDLGLDGCRALITGGSRGIGAAVATLLARFGCDVGITYHSQEDQARQVVSGCQQAGVRAWAERADLTDPADAARVSERCSRDFGGLDLLVANAGIWPPEAVALEGMPARQWERTLAVNLTSVFHILRRSIPLLASPGRVVLVASSTAQRGEAGHSDYAASKGGLVSLCKSLAVELAPRDITVNCVAPGWVQTDMVSGALDGDQGARIRAEIPLGRVAHPDDVAGPIVFLCSSFARHVTGEVLNINGGSVMPG